MRSRLIALSLLSVVAMPLPEAMAQRSKGPAPAAVTDAWELLGKQVVGFRQDVDTVKVGQNEEWFKERAYKTLRFTADGNDVFMNSVKITYINGYTEELAINQLVRKGRDILVDLRGERSYLREVEMRYKTAPGFRGNLDRDRATMTVHGERVARRLTPAAPAANGARFETIDSERVASGDSRVVFSASRGDGRFGQIRVRAGDEPVGIRDVVVRFGNGETQSTPVNTRLGKGEETAPIDLAGETRFLQSVTVNLTPDPRRRSSSLELVGARRPGATAPVGDVFTQKGWTLLGEQTVGFFADKDSVNVNQSEDWHKSRAFRKLHFVADRNDVFLNNIKLTYINGYVETLPVNRLVPAGADVPVELKGDRSYIKTIDMTYRSRTNFRGRAIMRVYGETVKR